MIASRIRQGIALGALLAVCSSDIRADVPHGSITIERIADIKYPSSPVWSPDGRAVAFLWDSGGKQDLFVSVEGKPPEILTDFPVNPDMLQSDIGQIAWSSVDELLFLKDGQLWAVKTTAPRPARVGGIDPTGVFALSSDRKQIAHVRQGQLVITRLAATGTTQRLTQLPEGLRPTTLTFSRDDRYIALSVARSGTEAASLPFNGTRIRSFNPVTSDRKIGVVSVHGGEPLWISTMGDSTIVDWTASGDVLFEEMSPDRKTRAIKAFSLDGAVRTLWKDYDPAWWSPTRGPATELSPDGKLVAFFSDRTGWTHLYVMPASGTASEARQLTSGSFTTGYPGWSPDSTRIVYGHGRAGNSMERFLSIVDVATGKSEELVTLPGVNISPMFSPDGARVLYQRTSVEHSLELYMTPARAGATSVRLTDSMPEGLDTADLTKPVAVNFPSRVDGKPVPATIMVSKTIDRTKKNPAIVWIHGSGSDQNYLGWHPAQYRMYYSIHQYLAQQGYVILTPDYRGSSGYDREWATGNYLDLGGKDYLDVASGADYLKTLDYVDPDRIGVWGLSYGGFMTLQAATVTPTLFRAAVDVAGVTDWEPRGGAWTVARLGSPLENPEAYYRSAPVKHMAKLERPLLVLHGTADANVAFHDSLALIDVLVKLGKDFETAIYPGELHFFRRAHVLRDAWRRAEAFFDEHLKRGPVMPSR